ncbi:hypothetical protein Ddye_022882 [Dipteronia dyeriana]|uniref:DJ-1/PfpI domain-containing protein n=1 Tax=Dipteronia dyeriana TaxID=168575 RepID=A0AAD9TST6_9ROSI|nr:hypothetical protein Ddye_022882 [Dipteronia dyeriana]
MLQVDCGIKSHLKHCGCMVDLFGRLGVEKVRSLARDRGLKKTPGWNTIEVNNKVEVFCTGNQTHPKCKEIYPELRSLIAKMKTLGYVPDYSFVLQDVEDDEKEHILSKDLYTNLLTCSNANGGVDGSERLQKSRILKKLLKDQEAAGRIYGAICSSSAVLHKHSLPKEKRATAHPYVISKLTNEVVNGTKVVVDGKVIISRGLALAITSKHFGHGSARFKKCCCPKS